MGGKLAYKKDISGVKRKKGGRFTETKVN